MKVPLLETHFGINHSYRFYLFLIKKHKVANQGEKTYITEKSKENFFDKTVPNLQKCLC